MKKILSIILLLFTLAFSAVALTSCSDDIQCTVDFIVDGSLYASISSDGKEIIQMPNEPQKEGYTFVGWYNGNNQIISLGTSTTGQITLTAKWKATEYTATFEADGKTVGTAKFTIEDNVIKKIPTCPDKNGYDGAWESYTLSAHDITVKAVYTPKTYTISYSNTKNAENENITSYTPDIETFALVDLSMTGYTFDGWYNGVKKVTEIKKGSYGDLTLEAKWTVNKYTATFKADGNTVGTAKFTIEDTVIQNVPTLPEKNGYDGAWENYTISANDFTVNAVYTTKSYTISYSNTKNAENGNVSDYTPDTETFTLTGLSKTGYIFDGWYNGDKKITAIEKGTYGDLTLEAKWSLYPYTATFKADGNTVDTVFFTIEDNDIQSMPTVPEKNGYAGVWESYTLSANDITINAVYTPNSYKITYVNTKGALNYNKTKYTPETETFTLASLGKTTGYTFDGWFIGDTEVTEVKKGTYGNLTIEARWTAVEYTATFKADGNTVGTAKFTVEDTAIKNMPSVPNKNGYDGVWENYALSTNDITVNAIYTATQYLISYSNTKNITNNNKTYYSIESDTFLLTDLSKEGYSFDGWYNGTKKVTTVEKGSYGNMDLVAKWTVIEYTATFKADGNTVGTAKFTVEDTDIKNIPSVPNKNGYEGVWENYALSANDITVNAVYTAKQYTISYSNTKGVTNGNKTSYTPDTATFALTPLSKTGYTFDGWYSDSKKITSVEKGSFGNLSLEARWQQNQYTVTLNANGGKCDTLSIKVTFDSNYTLPTPTRVGYSFVGWFIGSEQYGLKTWTIANNTTVLTASWQERNDIPYVVKHYQENIDDDKYTLFETKNYTGTSDATITAPLMSYTGFTAPSSQRVTVNPSGGTIVEYYYTRNKYTVFFENGCTEYSQHLKYGASLPNGERMNFSFGGWFSDEILSTEITTMPASNTTVFAWWQEETKPKDITYSKSDNSITITKYHGSSGTCVIPAYIGGIKVTRIGDYAFKGCTVLASISIPDSVTSIGYEAFSGCSGLESITLPFVGGSIKSATDTYQYPFGYIFGTESYTGSTAVTQYYYGSSAIYTTSDTYYIPSKLKSVTITGGNILYGAFRGCTGLTSVIIGNNVTYIGNCAFENCTGLTSITIPDSVTSIGNWMFSDCTGLTSITIPNSVTSIGSYAFKGCTGLISITVASGNTKYHSAGNCLIETESKTLIRGCKNYIIPTDGSVTSIGEDAFSGCTGLTSITIPDSVESIGYGAFSGCSNLESIKLPFVGGSIKSATDTYQYPFGYIFGTSSYTGSTAVTQHYYGYSYYTIQETWDTYYIPNKLKSVTITGGNILFGAFYNCTGLTSITIPESETSIGKYAFYWCTGLTSITIPDSVTSIDNLAFAYCTGLTSVTIGNNVESIGSSAFYGCTGLTSINIPGGKLTSIGNSAFSGCTGLTSITIPDSVTSIGDDAFYRCSGLTSIAIPDSVTSIGGMAFYGCNGLTSVTIGNSVTSIGGMAFYGCMGLTSIAIPDSVTSIGGMAFYGCNGLTSVTIGNSVTSIGEDAFSGCTGLTKIYISDIFAWCKISGLNYLMCNGSFANNLYLNGTLLTDLVIPDSVTSIAKYAFYYCKSLTSVTIGNSVTSIGDWAFDGCSGLTKIYISDLAAWCKISGLSYLMDWGSSSSSKELYLNGTLLTNLVIPDSVTSIGSSTFCHCTGLTSLTIGNSVTSIGWFVFYGCTGLTSITYNGTKAQWYAISKDKDWKYNASITTIICTDGNINY